MKSTSNGYTLIELMFCIGGLVALCIGGFLVWVAIHFIMKFW